MSAEPLRELEDAIAGAGRDELPTLIGALARLSALASLRLTETSKAPATRSRNGTPKMLTAHDVAERLGVSEKFVYAHREELGGAKLEGLVRFPERKIRDYLRVRTR